MARSIAFIHTVPLLVDRFRLRSRSALPRHRCFHMLDERNAMQTRMFKKG